MIITFERLYKISFIVIWAFILSYIIKIDWIVFLLIIGGSALHDLFGIGKIEKLSKESTFKDFLKEFFRIKFSNEWIDFGCSFIGFVVGSILAYVISLGVFTYFLFFVAIWTIFTVFAVLSRINEVKSKL